jgi:hypothetical protein
MGDFGNINYNVDVPSAAQRWEQAGQKVAGSMDAASSALMQFQQGVLKNEALKANTLLGNNLKQANLYIQTTPYVTREEVQKGFSGKAWEDLPEDLKKDVLGPVDNPDDPGIPMWKLAPHIFNRVAAESTDAAAKLISEPGWQNEFRTHASAEVGNFKGAMLQNQFEHYKADSRLNEQTAVNSAVDAQRWDYARAIVNHMTFHSPSEREALNRVIQIEEKVSPLKSAGYSSDPTKVQAAIDSIGTDPKLFEGVPQDKLDFYQNKLENHLVQLQRRAEHQQAQFEKAGRDAAGQQVFAAFRQSLASGEPIPLSVVPDPDRSKGITVETAENLLNLVEKMNKRDQKSNLSVRQDLITLRARDNVTFQNKNLLQNAKYLSPEDYYALEKMQMEDRMKAQDAGHAKELARMHSDKTDAINEFTGNKLQPHTRPEDKAKMDSLEYALDQGIEAWQKKNPGKYPDRETIIGISNLSLGGKTGTFTRASGSEALSKENLYVQSAIIKDVKQSGRMASPEVYKTELANWKAERKKLVEAWDVHAPGDKPSDQAMYDIYRALRDNAKTHRLDQQLSLQGITTPTDSARLQLLISPYASETARQRASAAREGKMIEDAALDEARRGVKIPPPPTIELQGP